MTDTAALPPRSPAAPAEPTLPLRAGRWALDHAHTRVGFSIRHLGIANIRGRFRTVDAGVVIGSTQADSSVTATVDLSSVDTGDAARDAHILAPDIVDVQRRPALSFRSRTITGDGDHWSVEGEASIGEVTRPLTLDIELGGVADFPMGGPRHAGLTARGQLRRSDYGVAPGVPAALLGDVITIEIDLELLEPEA